MQTATGRRAGGRLGTERPKSRAPEVRGWLLGAHCGSCLPFFAHSVIFEPRVSQTGLSTLPGQRGTKKKKEKKKNLFQSLFSCTQYDSDSLLLSRCRHVQLLRLFVRTTTVALPAWGSGPSFSLVEIQNLLSPGSFAIGHQFQRLGD